MPNETTTKVKTKTGTAVAILLTGGAIAAAAFIAGNRLTAPTRVQPTTPTLSGTPCALSCSEALQRCPCPSPQPTTVTPVTPLLQPLVRCDPTNPQQVPNLVVYEIIPSTARTEVIIGNTGHARLTTAQSFKVKLENRRSDGTWIEVNTMPVTGDPGTRSILRFPPVSGATWLKATIDSKNEINEYGWTGGDIPECIDGERDNVKEWQQLL